MIKVSKKKRVTIYLDVKSLAFIDKGARKEHRSRSLFMELAGIERADKH